MAIKLDRLPIKMVFFHRELLNYQRDNSSFGWFNPIKSGREEACCG